MGRGFETRGVNAVGAALPDASSVALCIHEVNVAALPDMIV